MKIPQMISKNFKVLFRTKVSLAILILSPLLVIIILGILFNNYNLYNINVGYSIEKENELNTQYIDILKTNFNLIKYDTSPKCIEGIKRGMNHICISFTGDDTKNQLDIKIDSSKNNIRNIVEKLVIGTLNSQTKNIQINNTEKLIDTLSQSEQSTQHNIANLNNLTLTLENLQKSYSTLIDQKKRIERAFNLENLDLEEFEENTENLETEIDDFLDIGYTQIDNMETEITTIANSIKDANFTSGDDEDAAQDSIADIEKELEDLRTNIYALKQNTDADSINSDLTDLMKNLQDTETILTSSIKKLNEVTDEIKESNDKLENSTSQMLLTNNALIQSINGLKVKDSQSIISPYEIQVQDAMPSPRSHLSNIFPSILLSLIFVISILLSANFILYEKESEASFRNFLVQTRSSKFFFANFITLFIIVFIQISIILIAYYFMFLRNFGTEILLIMLISIPLIMLFVLIGMIIGYISVNQTSNIVLSFVFIFLILAFSGLMIPLEILSQTAINIMQYNPYLIASGVFRKFILFNASLLELSFELIVLAIYIVTLLLIALTLCSITMRGLVFRIYALSIAKIKKMKLYKKINLSTSKLTSKSKSN